MTWIIEDVRTGYYIEQVNSDQSILMTSDRNKAKRFDFSDTQSLCQDLNNRAIPASSIS